MDELGSFSSLQAATVEAIKLVGIMMVGVFVGVRIVKLIGRLGGNPDDEGKGGSFNIFRSAIGAAAMPVARLLPVYGTVYAATVVSALLQVALSKKPFLNTALRKFVGMPWYFEAHSFVNNICGINKNI